MSESSKPPFLWIFIMVVAILVSANHWMSREMSQTAAPLDQPAPVTEETTDVVQMPVLRVPEPVVFDAAKKKRVKKKKTSQDSSIVETQSEPIYEPPVNSATLVQ